MASDTDRINRRHTRQLWIAGLVLTAVGMLLFRLVEIVGPFPYLSKPNLSMIMLTKAWAIVAAIVGGVWVYLKRESPIAPRLLVFFVSAYFVILYGLYFHGTEFGMNGHWGDNGNRLAAICKMMAFNTLWVDWYLEDLPAFYPPGWFALMAVYAKIVQIDAYATIKQGYLLIFLTFPWVLYVAWRRLASAWEAAAIVVAVVLFAHRGLEWVYYENITAALIIPWWLYYFEEGESRGRAPLANWKFYLWGSVWGAAMFVTYYYWFLYIVLSLPIVLAVRWYEHRSWTRLREAVVNKLLLGAGIAVLSSFYWLPLLISIYRYGSQSAQHAWYGLHHADLSLSMPEFSVEVALIFAGIYFLFYLWKRWETARLPLLYAGGMLTVVLDRIYNLTGSSIQARKVLEFAHVFALTPLGIGVAAVWPRIAGSANVRRGLLGLILLAALVSTNTFIEKYHNDFYRIAIGQRVPEQDLEVFRSVDYRGKVFLTEHYRESCYLPYFLFIPYNNMTSHTAGRYLQREDLLDAACKITEARWLAYALAYNKYSGVDYVYLHPNKERPDRFEQRLYQVTFLSPGGKVKTLVYEADLSGTPQFFVKHHDRYMFEVVAPPRTPENDAALKAAYPEVYRHLSGV
jgi:hypothetical protein